MNKFFYMKLAFQNLKKHAKMVVPYVLTATLFVMMFFVILSLSLHSEMYGRERGVLLALGVIVIAIFAVIFLFYTNSFIIKQRKSELGLYNILGMEKKHISRTLFYETFMMGSISIGLGMLSGAIFGQAVFLALMKMVNELPKMHFEMPLMAIVWTLILFIGIFLLTALYNISQIHLSKPIDLLNSKKEGEKEPKAKWLMALFGILSLGAGYYIAVTVKNPMDAMILFFVAVILVIVGTYLLFTAGSIALLKLLRKNKRYYYKTNHFVSVSNMIYRMKQNAAGLASICIMSTMVLVMVSSTGSLFYGVDELIHRQAPNDINLEFAGESLEFNQKMDEKVMAFFDDKDVEISKQYKFNGALDFVDGKWSFVRQNANYQDAYYVYVSTDDSIELKDQEAAVVFESNEEIEEFTVGNQHYDVVMCPKLKSNVNMIFGSNPGFKGLVYIGLKDEEAVQNFVEELEKSSTNEEVGYYNNAGYFYGIDGDLKEEDYEDFVDEVYQSIDEINPHGRYMVHPTFRKYVETSVLDFFGSFFFIGIFLSILFMIATALIMYYKQISEGYDDVKRFEILQKVGMSHEEVKKSIDSQILIVFFMPLITAGIHIMFAYNLIFQLFSMFGMSNAMQFASIMGIVFVIFSIFYFITYQLTARVYYRIVSN